MGPGPKVLAAGGGLPGCIVLFAGEPGSRAGPWPPEALSLAPWCSSLLPAAFVLPCALSWLLAAIPVRVALPGGRRPEGGATAH